MIACSACGRVVQVQSVCLIVCSVLGPALQVRQLQQLLVVSSYYEQHLPTPTPIIVLSSLLSPTLCAAANEHASVQQIVGPSGTAALADAEVEEDVQEMPKLLNIR